MSITITTCPTWCRQPEAHTSDPNPDDPAEWEGRFHSMPRIDVPLSRGDCFIRVEAYEVEGVLGAPCAVIYGLESATACEQSASDLASLEAGLRNAREALESIS